MLFHGIHTPIVLFCILMQQKKTKKLREYQFCQINQIDMEMRDCV
jgi:hypothetical protein